MAEGSSTISRELQRTKIGIQTALDDGLFKANNPGPNGNFLSTAVYNRLVAIQSLFSAGMDNVGPKEEALRNNSAQYEPSVDACRTACSLFARGINLGVDFGALLIGVRPLYGLVASTGKMPNLKTHAQVREFSEKLILGESQRVGAGGTPAAWPPISLVQTARTNMMTLHGAQSGLKDDYDNALEAVDALMPEAKITLKKVWDEVETFYNHEPPNSLRANAREWGVVYVSRGAPTAITFTVGGADLEHILQTTITMRQTGHIEIPNLKKIALFETRVVGPVQFDVHTPGFVDQPILVDIAPQEPQDLTITLQPL